MHPHDRGVSLAIAVRTQTRSRTIQTLDKLPEERSAWTRAFNAGSFLVGVGALTWIVHSVGLEKIGTLFAELGWRIVLVLAIAALVALCDAAALHALLRGDAKRVSYARVLAAQLAGQAINAVTPTGKLGEATKVTLLVRRVPRRRAVSSVVLVNVLVYLVDTILMAVGIPLTVWLFDLSARLEWTLLGVAAGSVVLAFGIVRLLRRGALRSLIGLARRLGLISLARRDRWLEASAPLDRELRLREPEATHGVRRAAIYVVLSRMLSSFEAGLLLVTLGQGYDVPLWIGMISAGPVIDSVGAIVPMGLGVTEGGNHLVFEALGAPSGLGLTIVLVRRVRQVAMTAVGLAVMLLLQAADRGAARANPAPRVRDDVRVAGPSN